MTSTERHEARYQRRKAARERKRREALDPFDDFDRAANPASITCAHWAARCGVMWKFAPAKYDQKYLRNSAVSAEKLQKGENICQGFYHFPVVERGKRRDVHSVHYTERVIRRAFCVECFVPIFTHNLIYDNGASLKGKGVSFAEKRCAAHLHRFYRETGSNEGYAIIVDFKNYFGNIVHDRLFSNAARYIHDPRLFRQMYRFVKASDADKPEAERGRGLYIGPEDSQILAVSFPNDIDHRIKDGMRRKYYARYNDDSYILVRTKEEARAILDELLVLYDSMGIIPNPKKTQVVKLSRGFTFLKTKYHLQSNGRLVRRPDHSSIVRQRRKLKSFRRFYFAGEMTLQQICQSYMSWRGHIQSGKNAGRTVREMDALFTALFCIKPWAQPKKSGGKYHERRQKPGNPVPDQRAQAVA